MRMMPARCLRSCWLGGVFHGGFIIKYVLLHGSRRACHFQLLFCGLCGAGCMQCGVPTAAIPLLSLCMTSGWVDNQHIGCTTLWLCRQPPLRSLAQCASPNPSSVYLLRPSRCKCMGGLDRIEQLFCNLLLKYILHRSGAPHGWWVHCFCSFI
jgi:hypothetical protein